MLGKVSNASPEPSSYKPIGSQMVLAAFKETPWLEGAFETNAAALARAATWTATVMSLTMIEYCLRAGLLAYERSAFNLESRKNCD
jgi:hypothetical protein